MTASPIDVEESKEDKLHSAWQNAEKHGIDMSLIESNLQRKPLDRMIRHEQARQAFMLLSKAGKDLHERHAG